MLSFCLGVFLSVCLWSCVRFSCFVPFLHPEAVHQPATGALRPLTTVSSLHLEKVGRTKWRGPSTRHLRAARRPRPGTPTHPCAPTHPASLHHLAGHQRRLVGPRLSTEATATCRPSPSVPRRERLQYCGHSMQEGGPGPAFLRGPPPPSVSGLPTQECSPKSTTLAPRL